MKKNLIAMAAMVTLAGLANTAAAQSSITMYGIVDAGLVRETGGVNGTVNKLSSGVGSVSRLGFRGTEDLGNGLSAIFTLESGFKIDSGEQDTAGTLFNRQAFMGLKSTTYGALTLGRQYTPFYVTLTTVADPFGTGFAGNIKNLFPVTGNTTRASNTILYVTPSFSGFSAEVAYSPGEQADSNSAGRQVSGALAYSQGPLNVRIGYLNRNTDVAPGIGITAISRGIGTNSVIAANYDFKVVKAFVAYQADKGVGVGVLPVANAYGYAVAPVASTDARDMLVGLTAPVAGGTVMASVLRKDDRTRFNQDANQWGIGYVYPITKRTNVYAAYAKINNKNGAGYVVGNNGESGTGNTGLNLGLRHSF
jgi:predicted porin